MPAERVSVWGPLGTSSRFDGSAAKCALTFESNSRVLWGWLQLNLRNPSRCWWPWRSASSGQVSRHSLSLWTTAWACAPLDLTSTSQCFRRCCSTPMGGRNPTYLQLVYIVPLPLVIKINIPSLAIYSSRSPLTYLVSSNLEQQNPEKPAGRGNLILFPF